MNIQNSFVGQINHEIRYRNCENTNRERKMEKITGVYIVHKSRKDIARTYEDATEEQSSI